WELSRYSHEQFLDRALIGDTNGIGEGDNIRSQHYENLCKLSDEIHRVGVAVGIAKPHTDIGNQFLARLHTNILDLLQAVEGFGNRLVGISLLERFRDRKRK